MLGDAGPATPPTPVGRSRLCQLRYPDTQGRIFYERKLTEDKTKKEAIRALKRRLSEVVYRHLTVDQQR